MRNSLQEQIKLAFDREGIEFPFPTRTLLMPGAAAKESPPAAPAREA
jgi:small-conductance mechanosensitive channel